MVTCEIGTGTSFVNSDGETGWVVPPKSPTALAVALNRLLTDAELAQRYGRAARQRYEALFSGDALGRAYARLFEGVLNP
jgi:rhamnosyl/mannosyltransferase